jgi:hypothetical protein
MLRRAEIPDTTLKSLSTVIKLICTLSGSHELSGALLHLLLNKYLWLEGYNCVHFVRCTTLEPHGSLQRH